MGNAGWARGRYACRLASKWQACARCAAATPHHWEGKRRASLKMTPPEQQRPSPALPPARLPPCCQPSLAPLTCVPVSTVRQHSLLALQPLVGAGREQPLVLHHHSPPMHLSRGQQPCQDGVITVSRNPCKPLEVAVQAGRPAGRLAFTGRRGQHTCDFGSSSSQCRIKCLFQSGWNSSAYEGINCSQTQSLPATWAHLLHHLHLPCSSSWRCWRSRAENCRLVPACSLAGSPTRAEPGRMNRALAMLDPCSPTTMSAAWATASVTIRKTMLDQR